MHRSNPWASDWLKRYDNEDIGGLKDKQKVGDHQSYPNRRFTRLRKNLKKATMGGCIKTQVEDLIVKKSGIKYNPLTYTVISFVNGDFKQKVISKVHITQYP